MVNPWLHSEFKFKANLGYMTVSKTKYNKVTKTPFPWLLEIVLRCV